MKAGLPGKVVEGDEKAPVAVVADGDEIRVRNRLGVEGRGPVGSDGGGIRVHRVVVGTFLLPSKPSKQQCNKQQWKIGKIPLLVRGFQRSGYLKRYSLQLPASMLVPTRCFYKPKQATL